MSHFLLRAGENWQENPETYEDSFYKRSLDNDNYVFTAPYFNSKYYLKFSIPNFLFFFFLIVTTRFPLKPYILR